MRTIYKYDITDLSNGIITAPIKKVLSVGEQRGRICVWAEVETNDTPAKWQFIPIPTGVSLDPPANRKCLLDTHQFYGTVQLAGGALIFHVYGRNMDEPLKTLQVNEKRFKKPSKPETRASKINLNTLNSIM